MATEVPQIGILSYAAYLPHWRLRHREISTGQNSGSSATRSVASYDEDTTTMAVQAARLALEASPRRPLVQQLYFSTVEPAYIDRTNATAIHAALGLPPSVLAADMLGSIRSGVSALAAATAVASGGLSTLVTLSDTRSGLPGSADERSGGDAAVAFVIGPGSDRAPVLAEHITTKHMTAEFLDRWRAPGSSHSQTWEDRFGENNYLPLALDVFSDALIAAGLGRDQIDALVVCGSHDRAVKRLRAQSGVRAEAIVEDFSRIIGNPGTAQPGVLLADALDRAEPGHLIAVVTLADGASASIWRTTDAISGRRANVTVSDQISGASAAVGYTTFLTWKGQLRRDPPRRPDPAPSNPPSSARSTDWKFGLVASQCLRCGMRHLPPTRVCWQCRTTDRMTTERVSSANGTIATFSVDHLAHTPHPPLVVAVIDLDGGGRFSCEMTDVEAAEVAVGDRVEMTFRRLTTTAGIHNYFWKARPASRIVSEEV